LNKQVIQILYELLCVDVCKELNSYNRLTFGRSVNILIVSNMSNVINFRNKNIENVKNYTSAGNHDIII